jgi:hypothetical protein
MIPRPLLLVILAVLATGAIIALAAGCATDRVTAPIVEPDLSLEAYLPSSDPVNVVANLEAAYRNRDIDAYAELFAPEFKFVFQPQDARQTGRESWGLADELRSTRNMFQSFEVKDISIRLDKQPAVAAVEPGLRHTMLVAVTHTFLRVRHVNRPTLEVSGDRQEFYLRRAYHEDGSERWLIVEWRDLPGGA